VPFPLLFGKSVVAKLLMYLNRWLAKFLPAMFGFQLLFVVRPRPTLNSLLNDAESSATRKAAVVMTEQLIKVA
jgi:hypothetical protein